ncbi:MAG TPA: hypothetical protein VGL56_07355 [Fimbriimonadaceae bacterium]|jgi:DNA-binding winged helix-turn-helix (wHTH) protein
MATTEPELWRLTYDSGFNLKSPNGETIKLRYKKLHELLLILANDNAQFVSRAEIACTLWPEASAHKQEVNVRQAIFQLKAALGNHLVQVASGGIRLAPTFKLNSDIETEQDNEQKGHIQPVQAFHSMLAWMAEWDPLQMLDLMRSNIEMSLGAPPDQIQKLLITAIPRLPVGHDLQGWVPFWRGQTRLMSEDIVSARHLFSSAAEEGLKCGDYTLFSSSVLWLGSSEILLTRLDAARRVAKEGQQALSGLTDSSVGIRFKHLLGTIMIHQGHLNEGLRLLEEAGNDSEGGILGRAINQGLRGLYLACAGKPNAARLLLERPSLIGSESGHFRLQSICELAEGHIALSERSGEQALRAFKQLLSYSASGKETHFEIYAREASALALWQLGERQEALNQISSARDLRRRLHMSYTDWDKMRLKPLALAS